MAAQQCLNCKEYFDFDTSTGFRLEPAIWQFEVYICSPSCLVENAWWFKEEQPKLSKSKVSEGDKYD